MSKGAEKAALEAYPYEGGTKGAVCEASRPIFIQGYEQGQKETIERAVEWLKEHWVKFPNPDVPTEIVVKQFRKAMEEALEDEK